MEDTSETEFKYYRGLCAPECSLREGYAGSVRIALREDEVITWLLSDHLGSTSVTVDATGNLLTSIKYTAFGELRTGTSTTDYQYTGQRNEAEIGLYYYVSRFYDPQLARFISADTIVPEPGSIQGYDRYAYTNNNPIKFNDPSGHCPLCVSAAIGAGIGAVVARRVGSNFEPTIKCFGYSLFEISKIEAGRSKNRHVRNEKDGTDL